MDKNLDVYGIGNAIMDLQVRVAESAIETLGLIKGGMQLVDTARQKELVEYFHGAELIQRSGGSAANTVIALAQLGISVGYGCTVGDDAFGEFYADEMRQLGVELHNQARTEPTGTCFILITPDAERTMNTTLGASASFGPEHISEEHIARAEWLYIEGYLLASDSGRQAALEAAECAKRSGTKVSVTFSDGFIVQGFRQALDEVVSSADLIFANEAESRAYTGVEKEDEVFSRLRQAAPNVVMTQHERGARAFWQGVEKFVPAFPTKPVDATGAGDMFAAGFLYAAQHKLSTEQALRVSNFLASKVVAQLGARIDADLSKLLTLNDLAPAAV